VCSLHGSLQRLSLQQLSQAALSNGSLQRLSPTALSCISNGSLQRLSGRCLASTAAHDVVAVACDGADERQRFLFNGVGVAERIRLKARPAGEVMQVGAGGEKRCLTHRSLEVTEWHGTMSWEVKMDLCSDDADEHELQMLYLRDVQI
jgi:hypothetical protein